LQAKEAAKMELHRRKTARDDLLAFTTFTMPEYKIGPHHQLIADKLQELERGRIKRLIISTPPRHGKSELTSTRFPAWYLGRHPGRQIITASYGAKLAQDFGRKVRNIVASPEFGVLFPGIGVSADSAARDVWHTTEGGVYVSVGVDGPATGKGAHLALIDDPIKDRQEGESEVVRETVWNWYRSVLRTRLMPGGAIALIMTRWHPDDLAGRLIADMLAGTGERWDILNLPAIAVAEDDPLGRTPGEALWPGAYPLAELNALRAAVGEREWASLYQGNPTLGEGGLFKVANIRVVDATPPIGSRVRAWDLAATREIGSRDPDWTVGLLLDRQPDGRFCVCDVVRMRGHPEEVEAAIVNTASQDGPNVRIGLPQDPGQAGKAQIAYLTRKLTGYMVESSPETGSKETRAAPGASQCNVGNVTLAKGAWNRGLLEELREFPSGSKDDQVDALSRAFAMLIADTYDTSLSWV
jgi:predicted phage terminase large subunit-like protein